MTKDDVLKLQAGESVMNPRDRAIAEVLGMNEGVLRIRYFGELSSRYIETKNCGHLERPVAKAGEATQ